MNKFICAVVLAVGAAFSALAGGQGDIRITFWTNGPDTYPDGSSVLPNEFYALVWSQTGKPFYGFNADGSGADAILVSNGVNRLLGMFPVAKGKKSDPTFMRCPECLQTVASLAAGSLHVVLLDTRVADGTVLSPFVTNVVENGSVTNVFPTKVNGFAYATPEVEASGTPQCEVESLQVDTISELPKDTPSPVVSRVALFNDVSGNRMMEIGVTNTVQYLSYQASSVTLSGQFTGTNSAGVDGGSVRGAEIQIIVPASKTNDFFKVIRKVDESNIQE